MRQAGSERGPCALQPREPYAQAPEPVAGAGWGTEVSVFPGLPGTLLPIYHSPSTHRTVQRPLLVLCLAGTRSCVYSTHCPPPLVSRASRPPFPAPRSSSANHDAHLFLSAPHLPASLLAPANGATLFRPHREGSAPGGAQGPARKVRGVGPAICPPTTTTTNHHQSARRLAEEAASTWPGGSGNLGGFPTKATPSAPQLLECPSRGRSLSIKLEHC